MKFKKIFNYFRTTGLLGCLLLLAVSCTKEQGGGAYNNYNNSAIRITVAVPESKIVSSRTLGETIESVQNLNVIVYTDESNPIVTYFDESAPGIPLAAGGSEVFEIENLFITNDENISVYLLANYGEELSPTEVATPDDLKDLTLTLPSNNVPENCVMFAQAAEVSVAGDCVLMSAELVRTLAKVTLVVEGNNLKDGLRITPTSFSIKNVPNSMVIGAAENKALSASDVVAEGYELPLSIGFVTGSTSVGSHNSPTALYLFENMQGDNPGVGNQIQKNLDVFEYASYVEVEANFYYSGSLSSTPSPYAGVVVYRFALGNNIVTNYDVARNTHYQLTLSLDNWGGAIEGGAVDENGHLIVDENPEVNWRVDINLEDWSFGGNLIYDGHATYNEVDIQGKDQVKAKTVTWIPDTYGPWIAIFRTKSGTHYWLDLVETTAASQVEDYIAYYIKPWRLSWGYPADGLPQYRSANIHVTATNASSDAVFDVQQWTPIRITDDFYMERFEEADLLEAPFLSSGLNLPTGIVFEILDEIEIEIGWANTLTLVTDYLLTDATAAQIAFRKAGIYWRAIPAVSAPEIPKDYNSLSHMNAAYYIPSKAELKMMLEFNGDVTDPYNTYHPLDLAADYWTSTVNIHGEVCYWSGADQDFRYTHDYSDVKRIRVAYRPSLDHEIDEMALIPGFLPWRDLL